TPAPDLSLSFNGAPSCDGGEHATGKESVSALQLLQWGPVLRRGGASSTSLIRSPCSRASMGPRPATGGSIVRIPSGILFKSSLQWGPVLRRGGAVRERAGDGQGVAASMGPRPATGGSRWRRGRRRARRSSFNGAPSCDGGELVGSRGAG